MKETRRSIPHLIFLLIIYLFNRFFSTVLSFLFSYQIQNVTQATMSPPRPCLTPSSSTVAAPFPPPKPLIPPPSTDQQHRHLPRFRINISRREATSLSLLSLFSSLHQPPPASAFSIGICEFLRFFFNNIFRFLFL